MLRHARFFSSGAVRLRTDRCAERHLQHGYDVPDVPTAVRKTAAYHREDDAVRAKGQVFLRGRDTERTERRRQRSRGAGRQNMAAAGAAPLARSSSGTGGCQVG